MLKWPVLGVAAALVATSCFESSPLSPELLLAPEGLTVEAFTSRTEEIQPDGSVELLVDSPEIAVKSVSLATIGAGGDLKIEISNLSGVPAESGPPPAEDVFQYIQIGRDNLDTVDVAMVTVSFAVARQWLESNGHAVDDVALERLSSRWEQLPTRTVRQDTDVVQYESVFSGLSLFAITADTPERRFSRLANPAPQVTATPGSGGSPPLTSTPSPTTTAESVASTIPAPARDLSPTPRPTGCCIADSYAPTSGSKSHAASVDALGNAFALAYAYRHSDADRDGVADAKRDAHAEPQTYFYADSDGHAHRGAYRYADSRAHRHANPIANTCAHGHTNADSHTHAYAHAYSAAAPLARRQSGAYRNRHRHSCRYSLKYSQPHSSTGGDPDFHAYA